MTRTYATSPVIGILGGMGPAATADFYSKLVALTPGVRDQDHPRVVIWADPTIPDRTLALTDDGPDPTPWLLRGAEILRTAGATMLAIPCNTAHAFLPAISARLGVPVVHMIDEVTKHIALAMPAVRTVGLLATSGTIGAGLYQRWFAATGAAVIAPDPQTQTTDVMPAIRALKAGWRDAEVAARLTRAARHLVDRGADVVVAGCTEIPLGLPLDHAPCPVIDPATVLAQALLNRVGSANARSIAAA
jgi:aspartate racemase